MSGRLLLLGPAAFSSRRRPLVNPTITAVEGLEAGHYTDLDHGTGCTVFICRQGAVGGVDVRGGSPGTRETDLLRPVQPGGPRPWPGAQRRQRLRVGCGLGGGGLPGRGRHRVSGWARRSPHSARRHPLRSGTAELPGAPRSGGKAGRPACRRDRLPWKRAALARAPAPRWPRPGGWTRRSSPGSVRPP